MKVVVIGAGAIGASVSYFLARSGVSVTLVDSRGIAAGTSRGSFAWLNAHDKQPRSYYNLIMAGNKAHQDLALELGNSNWLHLAGCVEWWRSDTDAATAHKARVARLAEYGHPIEWLSKKTLLELEPDISPNEIDRADIIFYPTDGHVDPVTYSYVLIREAQRHGAKVALGQAVTSLQVKASRVVGVELSGGEAIEADYVVNCAGRWANELTSGLGFQIPMDWKPGLVATTHATLSNITRILKGPGIYIKPQGTGRLLLHGKSADQALVDIDTPDAGRDGAQHLLQLATEVLPSIAGAEIASIEVVVRPFPADGKPVVGHVPGLTGLYTAVMHSGISLSPLVGRAVLSELVEDKESEEFSSYRPARWSDGKRLLSSL